MQITHSQASDSLALPWVDSVRIYISNRFSDAAAVVDPGTTL